MNRPDLLREIDQRNRDEYARQRMGALIEAYLAPVPSTRAETVAASPVAGATRPECWRPAVGRAPAATTSALAVQVGEAGTTVDSRDERPSATGRETEPLTGPPVSRPPTSPTGIGGTGRDSRMGRPSRPLSARLAEPHPTSGSAPRF